MNLEDKHIQLPAGQREPWKSPIVLLDELIRGLIGPVQRGLGSQRVLQGPRKDTTGTLWA